MRTGSMTWMIKVRNSWLCVWGVRAGVQGQCPSDGSVEAGYRGDRRQLGGGTGRLRSVRHHILCHTVLDHLHGGSIGRAGQSVVRHANAFGGKAVGFLSKGNLTTSDGLLGQLAGMITAVWQTGHGVIARQPVLAKRYALPILTEPASAGGDARSSYSRSTASPYLASGFNTGPCNDWRTRLSGAVGGIPPTPG